ncbi:phenylalanine--tRNA ligase subunit beta [Candidatus Woesearchaeota archaeon CG10_big_fil_rev_8_21_14_0_10_32_24]|nr:MAG: phenylalanine--tRNA ligase subunit beta [Candidatus Woesearchaeota archaeon CG10_big_fil_rev_8_21_14_0_10_32_24]
MVIVDTTFSRMQELVKKELTIEELEEVLADIGMELDEVNGDIIKIEITAERIDLISVEGLARAINSYFGLVKGYEHVSVEKSDYVHLIDNSVKNVREFTRSFVVKGLKLSDELIKTLMQVQEKIHDTYGRKRKKVAIGVYDLNLITFPITYKAEKPENISFVPLDMIQEMSGLQILEEHPKGQSYAHLLQGLTLFPIHKDAKGNILSMPPVINSHKLGKISAATKDLFVECTGPSAEALDSIMDVLATMFADWEGTIFAVTIKDGKEEIICPSFKNQEWTVTADVVKKLIGIDVDTKKVTELLPKMQYMVLETKGENIKVSIPSVRTDIWHPVDIADDVARAYGYNNITPKVPNLSTVGGMLPLNKLKEDLANFLIGFGLIELNSWALTNHIDQYEKMNLVDEPHIKLGKDTQDSELNQIRSWMIPEAIKTLVANRSSGYPQNVFELGICVLPDNTKDVKARNVEKLVCLLCEEKTDFTQIKQILDAVCNFIGIEYAVKESKHNSFIEGRMGNVIVNGLNIGLIGEIHPQVLDNWDLKMPVTALEIDLSIINKL